MCNLGKPQVPRGWQQVCQKAKMPVESKDPCSLFLSPNGKTFKTMDEVASYSKILDQEKMAREQKKMCEKYLYDICKERIMCTNLCYSRLMNW